MKKHRYYCDNEGINPTNENISIKWGIQLAKEISDIEEICLLIHTKRNTGYFERVFSPSQLKLLWNGLKLAPEIPPLRIKTLKSLNDFRQTKIVITFGLDSNEIFQVDDNYSVLGIIAHPWLKDSVLHWARTWGSKEIISQAETNTYPLPNKVVINAFDDLTQSINMSSGISHWMDEKDCKTYLRALYKYKYTLNENEIFAYLVREKGWKTEHALDVIKLIEKLNSGGYFQGGNKTGLQYHIKEWRKK